MRQLLTALILGEKQEISLKIKSSKGVNERQK